MQAPRADTFIFDLEDVSNLLNSQQHMLLAEPPWRQGTSRSEHEGDSAPSATTRILEAEATPTCDYLSQAQPATAMHFRTRLDIQYFRDADGGGMELKDANWPDW